MNLQSMEYVITTASEKSISRAAARLHITQQTLSAHISSLEKELGCQLFVRHVPLEITYAGEEFLKYAREIQRQVTHMRHSFSMIAGEEKGLLKIGVTHTRGRIILPPILLEFHRQRPGIEWNIAEGTNDFLLEKLAKGELDVCISDFAKAPSWIHHMDLYREQVVFLVSKALIRELYPELPNPTPADIKKLGFSGLLAKCPLLMSHQQDISGKYARNLIAGLKDHPIIKAEASNVELLLGLCVNGLGGCFCPDLIVRSVLSREQLEDMLLLPLGDKAGYQIRLGWKEDTDILESFLEAAKEQVSSRLLP